MLSWMRLFLHLKKCLLMVKILVLINAVDGINYHRLISPFGLLKEDYPDAVTFFSNIKDNDKGYQTVDAFEVEEFEKFSHVVFNRILSQDGASKLVFDRIKKAGCKTVMDIDDNWTLNKSHYMYNHYKKLNAGEHIEYCLKSSDIIIAGSDALKTLIGREVKRYANVVYNAIDPNAKQFETIDCSRDYNHVAFIGGIGHRKDLALILPEIAKIQKERYFTFTISGYAAGHQEWERLRAEVHKLGIECYFEAGRPVFEYGQLYADKGIIIAPLQRNKFNDYKSALKVIEAGHFSHPVICSDTIPFKNISGVLKFKKAERFGDHLRSLLSSKARQDNLGKKLNAEVAKKFNIKKENAKRKQILGL